MATALPFGLLPFVGVESPDLEQDPVLRAFLSAPVDDTPDTEAEAAALEEAMADMRAGRWVSAEEIGALIEQKRLAEGQ